MKVNKITGEPRIVLFIDNPKFIKFLKDSFL
jgi:hypothetical protein